MQFPKIFLSTLFAALATAASTVLITNDVLVTHLAVKNYDGTMIQAYFHIEDGDDTIICDVKGSALYNEGTNGCKDENWAFYIKEKALDAYTLGIFEQVGSAGIYGVKTLTLECKLDGDDDDDFQCFHELSHYHLTPSGS